MSIFSFELIEYRTRGCRSCLQALLINYMIKYYFQYLELEPAFMKHESI